MPYFKLMWDKTRKERELIRICYAELDTKVKSSKSEWTITYFNGIATVIKGRTKDWSHLTQNRLST